MTQPNPITSIRVETPQSGPVHFFFGRSCVLFIDTVVVAVEYHDTVFVRDDLNLNHRQRRQLNVWRPHTSQHPVDYYTFIVTLHDALIQGIAGVREEIFANA